MTQDLQESVIVSKKNQILFQSPLDWYVLCSILAPSRRWASSLVVNLSIHVTMMITSDSREKHHQSLGESPLTCEPVALRMELSVLC